MSPCSLAGTQPKDTLLGAAARPRTPGARARGPHGKTGHHQGRKGSCPREANALLPRVMDVERPGLSTSWNHGAQGTQDVAGTPRTAALGQEVREGAHPGICRPTTKEEPFPGPSSVLRPGDCPLGAGATVYLPRAQGCSQHLGLSPCPEPGEACPGRTRWGGGPTGQGKGQ